MSQPARQRFSFREYVRLEAYSNVRHEFLDGLIYARAGGTPRHAALAARLIGELRVQLRGTECEVFTSDLRVRVRATGLATYPDVTIVCGPLETDPEDPSTVVNPAVVIEVLSESTADYDRGEKLDHYRSVPSLREILLVSHRETLIQSWRRDDSGLWFQTTALAGERLQLPPLQCAFTLDELYRDLPRDSTS